MSLSEQGLALVDTRISGDLLDHLKHMVFSRGVAGRRCLLDQPGVADAANELRRELSERGFLSAQATAIQAIAFDKTPDVNWKVAWHQDLMFPFARPVSSPGYLLPTLKGGVHFAQPPVEVLNELLAVRLHLDDCRETNGPLRVSPGTHRLGIIPADAISGHVERHGQTECHAKTGESLLMRPLLLHASSKATESSHRRVLHFVFHSGSPIPETWAQSA